MKQLILLLALLLVFPTAFADKTQPINMTLNGTVIKISDSLSIYDVNLKGAPGVARAQGAGTAYPVPYAALPEGHECMDNEQVGVDGVLFSQAQMTMTFKDGSMLFGQVADGAYLCIWTPYGYVTYNFVGGTGRFEGATGFIAMEFDLYRVFPPGSLITPETGIAYGEIILP